MDYRNFQIQDFIEDAAFKEWVMKPDTHSDAFWNNFLEQHPEKTNLLNNARNVLLAVKSEVEKDFPSEAQVQRIFENLQDQLQETKDAAQNIEKVQRIWSWKWSAAASVLLVAGLALIYAHWFKQDKSIAVYEKMISASEGNLLEKHNDSDQLMKVVLPDGSEVTLEKNSRISYPVVFEKNKREVYLIGEAFFQVKKDPKKPFLVFANELVTKVLGTSFRIKAFGEDKNVLVIVKTGRVSVFANQQIKTQDPETSGLVLTPNQEVIFERADQRFSRKLVENPVILLSADELQHYSFDDAPVAKIFDAIEKAYGVDIVFDEEIMSDCKLTTSLTNETLFEKLDIVCKGIDAEYKVVDAQVIISSKGCR